MALMDPEGNTPEPQEVQEDYSDFSNPTNLLRTPTWVSASPEARPKLVDRAMNNFLKHLENKREKVLPIKNAAGEDDVAPVWSAAGTLTGEGEKFVAKTRQFLATAAQDPEGGIYQDDYSGKWETSPWVDDFQKAEEKKAFDPLHDLDAWKSERDAISTDTDKAGGTWEEFAAYANANVKSDEAKLDVDSKELKQEWARRMKISDFDPRSMGDKVFEKVGGQFAVNPATAMQMDRAEAEIEAMDIGQSEKRLLRLQHKDFVEKHAGEFVNSFAAADAGPLDAIYSRPLNDEFLEAMDQPGASAYEFIKANKERFNKDNYGVGQEVAETFRDAVMATGTGALWLGSGGNYTSPMEAWGGLAADSGQAYNNGKAFSIGGIDINRRDLAELTGQVGSFVAMGGMGSLAGRGLAAAGATGAGVTRFTTNAAGKLVARAAEKVTNETALAATKTFGEKAASLGKALATDPEMILGSLQASGMSYGKTFNETFERTGSRDEAHKAATITGVADGLSALIATGVMNRVFSPGAGKLLGMTDDGGRMGAVQQIKARFGGAAAMKETQEMFGKLANMTPELRKAAGAALAAEMNGAAKKLGLRGLGVVGDVAAEAVEESMDEIISGAIQSMSHDSKSWTEAEWEQISNNWQGYVKAGILGALGGTAGSVQGAAFNRKQVFGKSDALNEQEGMWKAIKANVARFDNPEMIAHDRGTGVLSKTGAKSVAEYLASDASVDEKAQVLVATARGNNLSKFTNAVVLAPTAAPDASALTPDTNTQPASPKGSSIPSESKAEPTNTANDNQQSTESSQPQVSVPAMPSAELGANPASESNAPQPAAASTTGPETEASLNDEANVKPSNYGKQADVNETDFGNIEPNLATAKTDPNESKAPKSLIQAEQKKADVPSGEALTKEEKALATRVTGKLANNATVASAPKVKRVSIPNDPDGRMRSSHVPEMVDMKESGLWVDTKGNITVEPRLMRELNEKHAGKSRAIADELNERVAVLNNSIAGVKKLDALPPGSAATVVPDADFALIVASDTIEKGQTDSSGGTWERVDNRTPQEKEASARNVVKDGMGEKVTYEYAPPKGHVLSVKVGEVVLIQGEPDNILILDSISNGRWRFRKVSLAADGVRLVTMEGQQKVVQWNRTRLVNQAEAIKPHLASIAQGTISIPDLRALLRGLIDEVASGFKDNFVEGKLEGRSYIQTNPDTGVVTVDMEALKRELNSLYQAVNTSNPNANEVLAADVARVMAKWVDEEVIHIIAGKEFKPKEMISLYDAIASNKDHPFHSLLKDTVDERYPGADFDPESDEAGAVASIEGGKYLVGMELIRKLHQMKNSGSYSERAVYESLLLQGAINKDTKDKKLTGVAKLVNTVAALVKRYSDRIRNILWMRYQTGRLPVDQQQLLFRLDAAYNRSNVKGDTEFAQNDVLQNRIELQRDFKEDLRSWGDKVTGQHFQAVAQIRKLKDNFSGMPFGNLFDIDPETLAMTIRPVIRQYLQDHKLVDDFQPIDALLDDLNDTSPTTGEIGRTGFERAKTLLFINRQVMEARMAAMDFDITPVLDLSGPDASKTLQRIGEHIEKTVPKGNQSDHYRELQGMWNRRAKLIQSEIDLIREGLAGRDRALIEAMNPRTNYGRREILAVAKRFGVENPFNREGINPNDVVPIMERLKARVLERSANLERNLSTRVQEKKDQLEIESAARLITLGAELLAARQSATDAEAKFITAQDAAPSFPGEASTRMTSFLDFAIALREYNNSVKNVHQLAFGNIWSPPKEFGLNIRDLDSRKGEGAALSFGGASTTLEETIDPDKTFGVKFERFGPYLGFRPKKHWGKNLSNQELMENEERAVLEIAGNSNAAFTGRLHWNQFYIDYMTGAIAISEDPDTYWQTGGFNLEKAIGENDSIRYEPRSAFQSTDVKLLNGLIFAAQDEAHRFAKKNSKEETKARNALLEHVIAMEEWARKTLALVGSEATLTIGGKQSLAGRVKPLIESQFAAKKLARVVDGVKEADGLVSLLSDLHARLKQGSHSELASELMKSELIEQLRARVDGANDASRLSNKSLVSFVDDEWRRNFEMEASRYQRQASFIGDNKELEVMRDAPADIRVFSNLSFLMKFHGNTSDYQMGSNFAFEAMKDYAQANRGEGLMPAIYNEKEGFLTDPNVYNGDDQRTNRGEDRNSFIEQRAGDSQLSAADIAINQSASPEISMRYWKTAWATMIGSQTAGEQLDIDAGRQFFFDLHAVETGQKSQLETKQLVQKGLRGTFPMGKRLANSQAFYDSLYNELVKNGLSLQSPSVETVLVSLLELKRLFEAGIVEQAKANDGIGRALTAVRLSMGKGQEVDQEIEEEIDKVVENPAFDPLEDDSPFSKSRTPRTITKKVKVKKVVKVKSAQANSLASPEEAEGVERLVKGQMLSNEGLAVYDASLLVHGIDGVGNALLSQLIQTYPGETLVVSPTERQVSQYGLDEVGFKIFRGVNGGPNVVYAPQGQKNPERNQTESWGGIAQSMVIGAQSNPEIRELISNMARQIRLVLDPAVFPESTPEGDAMAGHLDDLAHLGELLKVRGDGGAAISMFGDDQSLGSDVMIIAEILSNPKAKDLFDKAYIGTDDFQNTLLSQTVEAQLHEGIRNILKADSGAETFDQDYVDNATEDSVDEEVDNYDWENTRADSPWMEALTNAGSIEEQNRILAAEQVKEDKKANKFGPDARRINKRLAKENQGNGLNPSDAFLFNSLARIMELGKAGQPRYYAAPEASPTGRDILNQPPDPTGQGASTDRELNARVGPALKGEAGIKKAGAIYVGEMRNLTMPKVDGSTAHHIAFGARRITSTNASLLLRSEGVRKAVWDVINGPAFKRLERTPGATGLGRVDVSLPLDDEMMASIGGVLSEGVLDQHLTEARETIANLEADQARFTERREQLLASLAAADADNGPAFQALLDNSDLFATAKEWSESLKEQTRDLIVAHVSRFVPALAEASYKAYDMGHELYVTLSQGVNNNPQLGAAVAGIYKNINRIKMLKVDYDAQLRLAEDNLPMEKDTNVLLDQLNDAMRLFNLHASIFNSHAEMHARQAMKLAHVKGNPNLRLFGVRKFENTDGVPSKKQLADMQGSLAGMLNDEKFAEGFMQSMVKEITKGFVNGPATKKQTNAFMQDVAKTYLETGADLRSLIDEKINEALNDDTVSEKDEENTIGEDFRSALEEIAMGTAEARYILSTKMETPAMAEARRSTKNQLRTVERNLEQTTKALEQIDSNNGITPVGLGYYSDTLRSMDDKPITMGAQLALSMPSEPSRPLSGTMTPRDFWTRSTAVTRALTEQSENRISDAYKFVRGSGEQFRSFSPLKAINQAVDLVNVEAQIIEEMMQDARSDARDAGYKGLTSDAMAYLADPDTMMVLSKSARGKVKQINLPDNHALRSEKLGVLVNQDGDKLVMIQANARELLMRHWPQTITKRNVNRELSNMVLDALPVRNPGTPVSYSYFLNGTKAEEPMPFDGTGFSPAKSGLTKGEAAKAFADDWKKGMQVWLNDAMNMTVTGRGKVAKLDGDLAQAQLNQFAYMIERLVISHKDPRLSEGAQKKVTALLESIDKGEFAKIDGTSKQMDVTRMFALRVEPVFSQVFAEIETEAIQKALITGFVSFDGKKHSLELGALKYLHHQDARIRSKFKRNYAARQAAIHLQDFIEYGLDGKSGRQGYEIAKKAEEDKIAAAAKPLGTNAKNQTIGYLLSVIKGVDSAFAMHKENAANLLVKDLQQGLNELENLNAAQESYFKTGKSGLKGILPTLNRYWNADNLDMVRDIELAREVRSWLNESGITNVFITTEQIATDELNKLSDLLKSKIDDGKLVEVEAYAEQLNDSFMDISSAMQLTMAMLSRNEAVDKVEGESLHAGERAKTGEAWQDEAREAFKKTYSSVPLRIGYAAHPDPKERQTSSDRFITDPIDIVSLKDSSFFGGFGKGYYKKGDPFRPISVNGLTAPLSLLDDAIYKLNVTPTYEVLRRSFGRVVQDENKVSTISGGDFLNKANSMVPDEIDWNDPAQRELKHEAEANVKRFREALSVVAGENETVLQNDAATGVVNTGGAEAMRFLGSVYIVRALTSVQQRWNQTAAPSVGYAIGKMSVGKGKQAGQYFNLLQKMILSSYSGENGVYEQARQFVHKTDRSIYYRAADGQDVAHDLMKGQVRFGASKVKNQAGRAIRKYEAIGEKALHWSIGVGEGYISTAMYIVELAEQMQMSVDEVMKPGVELTAMAKSNARRKVNDMMGMSDQSKKSFIFQNQTSSPGRNALWRSMVRFSNQTASVASNTSVMVPVLFDGEADPATKKEALENVVSSLTQNILFTPFKAKMIIPLVAYLLYGLGGDDDDKAQKKAQQLANKLMVVDDESNMLAAIIKTITFGKKSELFQQDKKADAAQASAFAEIASKSLVELATAVPVFGVMAGYSPVSGLVQRKITDPLAVSGMVKLNNAFNRKKLKSSDMPYNANAVTTRNYDADWDENLASLTAPSAMLYDAASALTLSAQFAMTREARRQPLVSALDLAIYGAYEIIPFSREPRSQKRAELREVVKKESKRNR